jgi:hypothetical protein
MTHTISRRNFISFSAAIFAGIMVSPDFTQRIFSRNRLGNRLVKIFAHDPQAARAVGHAYLREAPQEYNVGIITEMILRSGTALTQRLDALSEKDLIAKLRNLITEDFTNGNTVQVEGWVLSRTEARLCALCALL